MLALASMPAQADFLLKTEVRGLEEQAEDDVPEGSLCQAILADNPGTSSGTYTVDPDGDGGVEPFEVSCEMVNGAGWLRLSVANSSPNGDGFFVVATGDRDLEEATQDYVPYYPRLDGPLNYDFEDDEGEWNRIEYINPASGSEFTSAELSAIRSAATELSGTTPQQIMTTDDDCYYNNRIIEVADKGRSTVRDLAAGAGQEQSSEEYAPYGIAYTHGGGEVIGSWWGADLSPLPQSLLLPEEIRMSSGDDSGEVESDGCSNDGIPSGNFGFGIWTFKTGEAWVR